MMVPATAGWQPEAAATSGVVDEPLLVVSDDAAGVLVPLLGIAALIGAAYMMESAQVDEDEDDVDLEIDEDDEDEDSEFDDYDDEDEDDEDED